MKATPLAIPDVVLLEPRVFGDDRGFFFESFNQRQFNEEMASQRRYERLKEIENPELASMSARGLYESKSYPKASVGKGPRSIFTHGDSSMNTKCVVESKAGNTSFSRRLCPWGQTENLKHAGYSRGSGQTSCNY